jgi:hypothetical protein
MNNTKNKIAAGTLMLGVIGLASSVFAAPSFASDETYSWGTTTPYYASQSVDASKTANSISLTKYSALSYVTYLSYNQSNEHQTFAVNNNQSNNDYGKKGVSKPSHKSGYSEKKDVKRPSDQSQMKYDSTKSDKSQVEMSKKDESKMSDFSYKNEDEHVNASLSSKSGGDENKEPCDESGNQKDESQKASNRDWKAKMSDHNWNQNDDEDSDSDNDSEELTYEKSMESFHDAQKDAKSESHESQSDESNMHEALSYSMNH